VVNIIYFKMDISWLLHYKVYIAPSKIHGVGLFAIDDIKQGEKIMFYNSKGLQKVSKDFLRKLGVKENVIKTLSRLYFNNKEEIVLQNSNIIDFVNFLNHNSKPNAIYKKGWYIAKNNIKANEEITLDFLADGYHPKLSFKEV